MNRVMGRARILVILVLVLALGMGFFVSEYVTQSGNWIHFAGSPHIYNAGNIGCGTITDRDGILLLDLTDGRHYAQNDTLRNATVHWLGDRQGNISAPSLSYYAEEARADCTLFGHTHQAFAGYVGNALLINPGALKSGSLCILELDGRDITPRFVDIDKWEPSAD